MQQDRHEKGSVSPIDNNVGAGTCAICLLAFAKGDCLPRLLPCGHSFCTACLLSKEAKGSCRCPKCHVVTRLAKPGAAGVLSLPCNFDLLDLLSERHHHELAESQARKAAQAQLTQVQATIGKLGEAKLLLKVAAKAIRQLIGGVGGRKQAATAAEACQAAKRVVAAAAVSAATAAEGASGGRSAASAEAASGEVAAATGPSYHLYERIVAAAGGGAAAAGAAAAASVSAVRDYAAITEPQRSIDLLVIDARGVAVDAAGNIIVPDISDHQVVVLSPDDGSVVRSFGSFGSGPGQFNSPEGVAVDAATGHIIVADSGNHRVVVLGADGSFVHSFGSKGSFGSGPGHFNHPWAVAVDAPTGHIIVADIKGVQIW